MRRTIMIVLVISMLIPALAVVGCTPKPVTSEQLTGVPGATPKAAADPAKHEVCIANERTFESQVNVWAADNGGPAPTSLDALKSQGVVNSVPTCPNGGTYSWDGSTLTCSVDGH